MARWFEISNDPNSGEVLAARRDILAAAYHHETRTRYDVILDHCRGKKVVDIGCVDHRITSVDDPSWLHGAVRAAAGECVGLDYDAAGIAQMKAAGLDAVCGDMTTGVAALGDRLPFDVVVAGEIIEHVPSPQTVLEFAHAVLKPGGKVVITTPNPYAPGRVRGGRRHFAFENVDHVIYVFPSGLAEMAERTGLVVRYVSTVGFDGGVAAVKKSFSALGRGLRRKLRNRAPIYNMKLQSIGRFGVPLPPNYITPLESIRLLLSPKVRAGGLLGETAIYVLEKPVTDTDREITPTGR